MTTDETSTTEAEFDAAWEEGEPVELTAEDEAEYMENGTVSGPPREHTVTDGSILPSTDGRLSFGFIEQPTATSMKRVKDHAEYDNTHLSPAMYGRRIHRDYESHVFRWGWAAKQIRTMCRANPDTRVLEVGCGRDLALFDAMRGTVAAAMPAKMLAVDLNPVKKTKVKWMDARGEFDFVKRNDELFDEYGATFDIAVNFEVLEHVKPEAGLEILDGIFRLLKPGGVFLMSTPVYNGHRAVNHVYELTVAEAQEMLEAAGFVVEQRYGTFASWNDIKRGIREDERLVEQSRIDLLEYYDDAAQFYGHDVMACFLAPKYPDHSRNNAWFCCKPA